MGSLAAFIFDSETAHNAVSKVRSATKGNFFANFVLQFGAKELQATLDAGAPTIEFSSGVPTKAMVAAVRAAKAKLGIQVVNAESTRVALDLGADFLVCQGTEAGGHVEASRGLYETLAIVLKEAGETPVVCCRWDREWRRNLQGADGRCLGGGTRDASCCNCGEHSSSRLQTSARGSGREGYSTHDLLPGRLARDAPRSAKSHFHHVGNSGMQYAGQKTGRRRRCRDSGRRYQSRSIRGYGATPWVCWSVDGLADVGGHKR